MQYPGLLLSKCALGPVSWMNWEGEELERSWKGVHRFVAVQYFPLAHSLLLAGAMTGMSVRVGHPDGYAPAPDVVDRAEALAAANGGEVVVTTDPVEAVRGADAVYTDVWASMGQESEAEARRQVFAPYQVTSALMAEAATDAIFLHCLPAHRGEEVAAEVIDGPASRVFDQAENRLHAQKALLVHLLDQA